MSKKGIQSVADIFTAMQQTRLDLIREADPATKDGKQDLQLAVMLDEMKDAGKEKFMKAME